MKRKSKAVSESAVENYPLRIFPEDLNPQDKMFGGMLVGAMDKLAASIFFRHTGGQSCGTKLIDTIPFYVPAYKGDLILLNASINRVWNTSCEIGVRADVQRKTGEIQHLSSTYFTYVATEVETEPVDTVDSMTWREKIVAVPVEFGVYPRTKEQKRRWHDAEKRREARLK